MRTTVATVVAATLSMSAFSAFAAASLTGAGATFPAPVYAKWADTYQKETGNKVNYQGIGSSGGVKQITATPLISVLLMLLPMTNWLRKACSSSRP
jgi:phosphate transport system substrate-binding protein